MLLLLKGNVKNVELFEQKSKIDIVAIAEFVLKITIIIVLGYLNA